MSKAAGPTHDDFISRMKKITDDAPEARSADLLAENVEQIKALFPETFAEGKIDFEILKQLLGGAVEEREEKYGLNWHGKRQARQLALTPSTGTLRPCPEESIDWDTTRNLMIEGDNLEVLKLLQKSYAGKVKLIYIDPPYNTGKDFVYEDDYRDNIRNYLKRTGQVNGENRQVSSNTEASGRFHTNWLNMMYPRLKLARNLLREDGVIFISIDDVELSHIRILCDNLFGDENFCGVIKRRASRKTAFLSKRMTDMCDYVVAYVKTEMAPCLTHGQVSDRTRPVFNGGNPLSIRTLRKGATAKCSDGIYRGEYPIRTLSFRLLDELVIENGIVNQDVRVEGPWRINQDVLDKTLFITRNFGMRRNLLPEELNQAKLLNDLLDDTNCYNEMGTEELSTLLGKQIFDNPKPLGLVKHILDSVSISSDDLILDFFAGSGTTGHAVMANNCTDSASCRYILVQLPEPFGQKQISAAELCSRINKPHNIAELTKERLRRAATKIKNENPDASGDLGFRVFKLDTSNIQAWNPPYDNLEKALLDNIDHLKSDRSEKDILYELLLKLGLDLCMPIETHMIAGKSVYIVGAGTLIACLDEKINGEEVENLANGIVEQQAKLAPLDATTVIFRDSAFVDDVAKTNLTAILSQHGLANVRSI